MQEAYTLIGVYSTRPIRLGTIPVIALAASIALIYLFRITEPAYNPPYVLFILNFLLITISNLVVAAVSAQSFLKYGALNTLLLSNALIISGLVSFISGWIWSVSVAQAISIQDIGLLTSAGLQVMSAMVTFAATSTSEFSKRAITLAASYILTMGFIVFLTLLVVLNLTPVFFTETAGSTVTRDVFLGMSVFFLALSSSLFLWQYKQSRSESLYWYSMALILFALSFVSLSFQMQSGDIYNWIGRIAQYLAGFYFLVALVRLSAGMKRTMGISEKWAEAFTADRKQLAVLFANMLNGFCYNKIVTDDAGRAVDFVMLEVNDAFERITGLPKDQVVGKTFTEAFPRVKEEHPDFFEMLGDVALSEKPVMLETYFIPLKKWLTISAYSPRKGYFVLLFEDVTERRHLQQKLEEYTKNLERLVEERTRQLKDAERLAAIGQTAGMVGHDIRNPLQAITNELYIAKESVAAAPEHEDTRELLESISLIQEQTDYISKIVSDLQDFARPLNPQHSDVDLSELITRVILTIDIPNKIELSIDVKGTPKLKTDPTFIRRVLTNLANNAIQAMPDGGKLELTAYQKENTINITLSDTGKGIPEEIKPKIFTPLVTTKAKGQGLGLAVVKRLVDALGGTITFESELGRGTKFFIELPLSAPEKPKFE